MLFLSAFARLIPREPEANDLLAESHAALGHVGLTIIAIVFVLVTFWKSCYEARNSRSRPGLLGYASVRPAQIVEGSREGE